jgi:ABC-type transport system involved in multi-copper enzyme maturation permease subunit
MNTLTHRLRRKELHLNRELMAVVTAVGLISVYLASTGQMGFNLGMLSWMTSLIALGVILALNGVVQERKDRALLFVMSLPLSAEDHLAAKQSGLILCFFVPWLILSCAAVVLMLIAPGLKAGLLPFTILLSVFLFLDFLLILAGVFLFRSDALVGVTIILTNMSISVFMMIVGNLPVMQGQWTRERPLWNQEFWWVLAIECTVMAIAIALPRIIVARRKTWV